MINDIPGVPDAWQRLQSGGRERYLDWVWFQRTGLLVATNQFLAPYGMQMHAIYSDREFQHCVGFDVMGEGESPLFYRNDDVGIQVSCDNFKRLVSPRIPLERRRRPRPTP